MLARANFVFEFEETLTKDRRSNPDWFPTYLQVLVPTLSEEENGEDDAWRGKMRALRKTVTGVKTKLGSEISELKSKLVESDAERRLAEAKRDEAVTELNAKSERLEQKSDRLEHLLTLVCKHLGDLEKTHEEGGKEEDGKFPQKEDK